jgi:hypothetical protein
MYAHVLKSMSRVLALALVALMPVALGAQTTSTSNGKTASSDSPSKWDIFAGYSYLAPHGTILMPEPSGPFPVNYVSVTGGAIVGVSRYYTKHFGFEGIGDFHLQNEHANALNQWPGPENNLSGGELGIIVRYPTGNITPFVHALAGAEIVGGPHWQTNTWGPTVVAGGGMDYETPLFNHHLAIRLFQADYQYIHVDFGPQRGGGRANINAARLSAGIVFHKGGFAPPAPVTLACSASPASIFPGDPVTVTATAGSLDPKLNAIYSWSGTGVTGSGTTATVATGSLAAGTYTVQCSVKEGKAGKEGLKPWENASSSTSFTVKAYEPPTIGCSASPSTIKPGESSTITASGMSPQNRPLTYSYSASAGTISGSGSSASFSSTGAPTGATAITCNVSDDKGQTATASTSVTITAPYVAPIPHTQALCSITFDKDTKRPARVDNEAKACLDQVALGLQQQSDAKAVVVGESTAAEKAPKKGHKHAKVEDLAGERAVNTKDYLVTEKGIDASRISVATGTTDGQTVEDYLVPAGATFTADVAGTTAVDETVVKPLARKPLAAAPVHKKHAASAKAAQ